MLSKLKARPGIVYAVVAVALVGIWYGRYLASSKVGILDWQKDGYALAYLKFALSHFHSPPRSFVAVPQNLLIYPTLAHSASYWANPEVVTLSPLMLPLLVMSVGSFFKLYFLLHVAIACVGIYVLCRRLGVGLVGMLATLVFIGLNPWLLQHVAVGYTPWVTACYAPLIVAMLVGSRLRVWEVAVGSVLQALIIYEGGLHVFVWLNAAIILVTVILAARRRSARPFVPVGVTLAGAAILAMPKLVASSAAFGGLRQPMNSSYASVADLWGLLTDRHSALYDLPRSYHIHGTALYDGSTYVGLAFLLLAAAAIAHLVWRSRRDSRTTKLGSTLLIAAATWLFLGWDGIWKDVVDAFSSLAVERYPFRFLAIAVVLVAFVVAMELDVFARRSAMRTGVALIAIAIVAIPLWSWNDKFARVGTSSPAVTAKSVDDVLTSLQASRPEAPGAIIDVDLSSTGIALPPMHGPGCANLPFISPDHVHDFVPVNARASTQEGVEGVVLCPKDPNAAMHFEAKAYHRNALLAVSAVAYALFLGGLALFNRRRPRLRMPARRGARAPA